MPALWCSLHFLGPALITIGRLFIWGNTGMLVWVLGLLVGGAIWRRVLFADGLVVAVLLTISRWWPSARSEGCLCCRCWGRRGRAQRRQAQSWLYLYSCCGCFCGRSTAQWPTIPRTQRLMCSQTQHRHNVVSNCSMALVLQLLMLHAGHVLRLGNRHC